jgi:hypothetical protein
MALASRMDMTVNGNCLPPGQQSDTEGTSTPDRLHESSVAWGNSVSLDRGSIVLTAESPTIRCVDHVKTASGRRRYELTLKTELFRIRGRLGDFVQEADRRSSDPADWRWRKRVLDHETGDVLWDADEPLSGHKGHGSARAAKRR